MKKSSKPQREAYQIEDEARFYLESQGFQNIQHIDQDFDYYAEKEGGRFLIEVKSRKDNFNTDIDLKNRKRLLETAKEKKCLPILLIRNKKLKKWRFKTFFRNAKIRRIIPEVWFPYQHFLSKLSTKRVTVKGVKKAIRLGHTFGADMARFFRVSRQYMNKCLKKMLREGIIEIDVVEGGGKVAKFYKVVEPRVKQTLKQCTIEDYMCKPECQPDWFQDNVQISYGILNYDEYFVPDNDWVFGKTLMKGVHIDDVFIRICNDKTITFVLPKVYGKNSYDVIARATIKSLAIKEKFLKKWPGFEFTKIPVNESLGCLGTTKLKQTINTLNPKLPIKTDSFVIDSTPEKGSFEMKIKDRPLETAEKLEKTVDTILSFPNKLDRIETILEKLVQLQVLKETTEIEKIGNILDKVPELSDLIKLLKKNNKKKKTQSYIG